MTAGRSGAGERAGRGGPLPDPSFEAVIGLEIHVQLRTRSKMFCGNAAEYGAPPNTHLCPVCLGLPGALPVLNGRAVELGVRAALGLGCDVHPRSVFARKNYFYPDLPKGYQISQHAEPLATAGSLEIPGGAPAGERRVRIRRVHLEEDTGKSLHDRVAGAAAIDLNRAGVPLIEIVSEPDLRSPADARAFLVRLKQALEYLRVSDCNMEEGSLRVDANLSVRRPGAGLGTKTELKNLNSFSNVERALEWEIARQVRVLGSGRQVRPVTLLWDAARGEARVLRSKEELHDYRYFPEPDLPPLVLAPEWIAELRAALPEMPWARQARFQHDYGLSAGHAQVLTSTRELGDYYEAVVRAGGEAREAANWVMGEVLAVGGAAAPEAPARVVPPAELAALLQLLASGTLSRPTARQAFARMAETGRPARRVVEEEGLAAVRDERAVRAWVEQVLAASPREVERFRAGEARLMGFFVGRVMRLAAGRADPALVHAVLRERLGAGA